MQRYVSTDLTHFLGRNLETDSQRYELLVRILRSGELIASGLGGDSTGDGAYSDWNEPASGNEKVKTSIVCFCDIPIADMPIHMKKYGRFGISFRKALLAARGANPVFYIARDSMTPGANRARRDDHFNNYAAVYDQRSQELLSQIGPDLGGEPGTRTYTDEEAVPMLEKFSCFKDALQLHIFLMRDVFSYFKFLDANSPLDDADNYYMEREWRILGNVDFIISEVCRIIMPNEFASQFRKDFPKFAGEVNYAQD